MEPTYRNVHFLFIGVLFTAFAGFFFTYFIKFPAFEGISMVKHVHGLSFFAWFAMLIAQPILIKKGKLQLHRALGKISYVLVPLIVLGTILVGRDNYFATLAKATRPEAVASLALNVPGALSFAIFYGLAIWHRKKPAQHMRYMICTVLPMLGPGLGRALIIFGKMPFPMGVAWANYATIGLALALMAYDLRKGKNFMPYVVALVIIILSQLAFTYQMGTVWQAFGGGFAGLFFE